MNCELARIFVAAGRADEAAAACKRVLADETAHPNHRKAAAEMTQDAP